MSSKEELRPQTRASVPEEAAKLKTDSRVKKFCLPYPPPPTNADDGERKGVAEKAIRKAMKIKGAKTTDK
jgi:hypothetical protein